MAGRTITYDITMNGKIDSSIASGFKQIQSAMQSMSKVANSSSSHLSSLSSKLRDQQSMLSKVGQAYGQLASEGQQGSQAMQELAQSYLSLRGDISSTSETIESSKTAYASLNTVSAQTCQEIAQLNSAISEQEGEFQALQFALDAAVDAYGHNSQEALELQRELRQCSQELDQNKAKMQEHVQSSMKMAEEQERAAQAVNKLTSEMSSQKSRLEDLKTQFKAAYLEENTQKCEELGAEIKRLSGQYAYNQAAMRNAAKAADAFDQSLENTESSAQKTEKTLTSMGVALGHLAADFAKWSFNKVVDLGKDAFGTVKDFEASMSKVAALSGAQGDELTKLTQTARKAGAETVFSATEAADALGYMALAGWDTSESIAGLPGVLNLAAASGMDLAQASDMVTDYLTAFGLSADKATDMADMLSYAQANSNTTTEQLGEAFKNCAANMNAAGQDIQTTTAFLEAFANQGKKGSEAGTALSAIMRDLSNSASKAADGMIHIGNSAINIKTAEGNYKDLTEIMKEVETATQGMGSAERDAALRAVFTDEAIRGVNMALQEGIGNIEGYESALNNCSGTAKEMADAMNDNLSGDLSKLNSAWQEFQLKLGDAFGPALRVGVQFLTDSVIPALNNLAEMIGSMPWEQWAQGITGFLDGLINSGAAGAIASIVAALGIGMGAFKAWNKIKALNPFSKSGPETEESASSIGSAVSGIGEALTGLIDSLGGFAESIGTALSTVFNGLADSLATLMYGFNAMGVQGLAAFAGSVAVVTGAFLLLAACQGVVLPFLDGLADIILKLCGVFPELGTMIGNCAPLVEALGVAFEGLGEGIESVLNGIASVIESVGSLLTGLLAGVADVIRSVGDSALNTGKGMEKLANGMVKLTSIDFLSWIGNVSKISEVMGLLTKNSSEMANVGKGFESLGNGVKNISRYADEAVASIDNLLLAKDNVQQAFDSISTASSSMEKVKETLSTTLGDIANILKEDFADVAPEITQMAADMSEAFNEFENDISTFTSGITEKLGEVAHAMERISEAAANAETITQMAGKLRTFGNALQMIAELDAETASKNIYKISFAAQAITAHADSLAEAGEGFKNLGDGIKQIAQSAQSAVEGFNSLAEAQENIVTAIATLKVCADQMSSINDSLESGFQNMTEIIETNFVPMTETIKTASAEIQNAINEIELSAMNANYAFQDLANSMDSCFSSIEGSADRMVTVNSTITENINTAQQACSSALKTMKQDFNNYLLGCWTATNSKFTAIGNKVRSTCTQMVLDCINAVSSMRAAFNTTIQGPRIRVPQISVSSSSHTYGDGQSVSVPHFSVEYQTFAKGGILNGATLFGMLGGKGLIGGEAGPEAVLPLSELWKKMNGILTKAMEMNTARSAKNTLSTLSSMSDQEAASALSTTNYNQGPSSISLNFNPKVQITVQGNQTPQQTSQITSSFEEILRKLKDEMFEELEEKQEELRLRSFGYA